MQFKHKKNLLFKYNFETKWPIGDFLLNILHKCLLYETVARQFTYDNEM